MTSATTVPPLWMVSVPLPSCRHKGVAVGPARAGAVHADVPVEPAWSAIMPKCVVHRAAILDRQRAGGGIADVRPVACAPAAPITVGLGVTVSILASVGWLARQPSSCRRQTSRSRRRRSSRQRSTASSSSQDARSAADVAQQPGRSARPKKCAIRYGSIAGSGYATIRSNQPLTIRYNLCAWWFGVTDDTFDGRKLSAARARSRRRPRGHSMLTT